MMMMMMVMVMVMMMMMTTMPGECWGRASREGCRTAQGCSYQCQTGRQVKGIFQNCDVTLTAALDQVINLLFGQVHPEGLGGDGVEVWQAEEGQAEADVLLDLETSVWAKELNWTSNQSVVNRQLLISCNLLLRPRHKPKSLHVCIKDRLTAYSIIFTRVVNKAQIILSSTLTNTFNSSFSNKFYCTQFNVRKLHKLLTN